MATAISVKPAAQIVGISNLPIFDELKNMADECRLRALQFLAENLDNVYIWPMRVNEFIAYIDPGTGSLLLQIVAGGIIASMMFFKRIWYTVFSFFKKKKGEEAETEE